MDWVPWAVTFIAGQASGLGIALLIAWIERRWHRQDVRAAEKRTRLDDRFEPVLRYGAAMQEFVQEAVLRVRVWQDLTDSESRARAASTMLEELDAAWARAQALEPRPGPRVTVRDRQALAGLTSVTWLAHKIRRKSTACLREGDPIDPQELDDYIADAEESMVVLRGRTEQLVEGAEPWGI